MIDIERRLEELRELGLYRRTRLVSGPAGAARRARRQAGPAAVLQQLPRAWPTTRASARRRPTRRCAGASGAGASRLVSGTMTVHRRLEERWPTSRARVGAAVRLRVPGERRGRRARSRGRGDVVFSDELNHASIIDGCRLSRAETFVYATATSSTSSGVCARPTARGALIVTDGVFSMDGDVAPLAEIVELARRHGVRSWSTRRTGTGRSARAAAARSPRPASRTRSTSSSARWASRSAPTAPIVVCDRRRCASCWSTASRPFIFSTAPPPPAGRRRARRAGAAGRAARTA